MLIQADHDQLFELTSSSANEHEINGDDKSTKQQVFRSYSFPSAPDDTECTQSFYLELLLVASLGIQTETKMMNTLRQKPLRQQYHHFQPQSRLIPTSSQPHDSTKSTPSLSQQSLLQIKPMFFHRPFNETMSFMFDHNATNRDFQSHFHFLIFPTFSRFSTLELFLICPILCSFAITPFQHPIVL